MERADVLTAIRLPCISQRSSRMRQSDGASPALVSSTFIPPAVCRLRANHPTSSCSIVGPPTRWASCGNHALTLEPTRFSRRDSQAYRGWGLGRLAHPRSAQRPSTTRVPCRTSSGSRTVRRLASRKPCCVAFQVCAVSPASERGMRPAPPPRAMSALPATGQTRRKKDSGSKGGEVIVKTFMHAEPYVN